MSGGGAPGREGPPRREGAPGREGVRALARLARPTSGERLGLAVSVALATGAAAAAIALLATSGYLISRAAQRPQILTLMVAIVAVRAFGIARAGLRYAERLVSHDLALRHLARLRLRFYRGLVPLVPGSLATRSGDLLSRFVADVDTLQDVHLRVVIPALVSLLVAAGAALVAWLILPAAGVAVLLALLAGVVLLPALGGAAAARAARRQAPARARLSSELVESIDGAAELALAGRSAERAGLLARSDARLARIGRGDALASAAAVAAGGALLAAGVLALLLVAIPAVGTGALSGVLLAALVFLLLGAYESVLPLGTAARRLRACATAAGRLTELTRQAPAVLDPPEPRALTGAGELRMEGVDFRYEAGQPWVLRGAGLRVAAHEHVALTGPSGVGKSTIAELLVRFADPSSGSVSIEGIDLRELAQSDVRDAVVLCAQDCHVFNTTIRENLLIGRRDADDADLVAALAAVELQDWVAALPQGLDTIVGQAGELASGGQRRRLALARALLSRARFLVLDEPTAHLDRALAQRVMANVLQARAGRAVLVITHEAASLHGFDRVVRLERGALADVAAAPAPAAQTAVGVAAGASRGAATPAAA
jgi:thiol reductant ABC exporter CydC subunit